MKLKREKIGQILIKNKLITKEELETCLEIQKKQFPDKKIGRIIVEKGYISEELLFEALRKQFKHKYIGEIFIEQQYVNEEDIEEALAFQKKKPSLRIGEILVLTEKLTEEKVADALAIQFDYKRLLNAKLKIDPDFLNSYDNSLYEKYGFLPLNCENGTVQALISDPTDFNALARIEQIIGYPVEFIIASKKEISQIKDFYLNRDDKLEESEISERVLDEEEILEKDDISKASLKDETNPIVQFVNSILYNAHERKVSDIHIEAYENSVKLKYRIDGVLQEIQRNIKKSLLEQIISRIKILADLDITEKSSPQDGRFKLKLKGRDVDFRVSIMPTIYGESTVIRILNKYGTALNINSLGMDEQELRVFKAKIEEPDGIIIVAGPTGSGKTTTLYSALSYVKKEEDKIITIEDPVEYVLPDIVQIAVNPKKGITFASGLRAIVRQDPDKIMVGEIRDKETAEIAVQAALTGHLVFTTIHGINAVDSIGRLINMGIQPFNLVSALRLVFSQRLLRLTCSNCKQEDNIDNEKIKKMGFNPADFQNVTLYKGKGCSLCDHTGYKGRTAIFEFLPSHPKINEMILNYESPQKLTELAIALGMRTLRQAGLVKVKQGLTSLEELNRVTSKTEEL